jgi:catechol 2,3-dioxygenase-like lactoylglutathione lyase family enzyme
MPYPIGHVNIVVKDLKKTADFFVKNFGFTAGKPVKLQGPWVDQLTGYKNASARYMPVSSPVSGGTAFNILKYITPPSPPLKRPPGPNVLGYRHVGFNVTGIDAMVAKLKAQGYKFFSGVVLVTEMNLKTVYFYGPERIIVQLIQPLKGA